MNVLLIGNGAREHVIAECIVKSAKLYTYMKSKNPGLAKLSEEFQLGNYSDLEAIKKFAKKNKIDFAFIGPEDPLSKGVVDALETIGVKSVGPVKELAKLETSKKFTRNLLKKYKIDGNPKFKEFSSMDGVREFLEELGDDFVVKADGLHGGKGVKVSGDHLKNHKEAIEYAQKAIEEDGAVVIEEKLVGEEFSLQCFADGKKVLATPPAQDHKRAYVGDKGPNTGGMGSYSDSDHLLPFLKQKHVDKAMEITQKVLDAIKEETGVEYKGIMYGGFMLTKDGVKLIEYNARFGDPEAMNVLPIMKTDFVKVCQAVIDGSLGSMELEFDEKATVCKYAVPEGYPDNPQKGEKVDLGDVSSDVKVYYASVDEKDDGMYMSGSRAIAFVGIADSLDSAEKIAEKGVKAAKGPVFHREDIGTKELVQKRVEHMNELIG